MARQIFIACDSLQQQDTAEPTVASLLNEATELSLIGFQRAAGCILRQALTLGLINLCFKFEVWPRNQRTGRKLKLGDVDHCVRSAVYTLDTAGIFSAEQRESMFNAIDLGNMAAHRGSIGRAHVNEMLAAAELIRSRLKGYNAPCATVKDKLLESLGDEPVIAISDEHGEVAKAA